MAEPMNKKEELLAEDKRKTRGMSASQYYSVKVKAEMAFLSTVEDVGKCHLVDGEKNDEGMQLSLS